MKSDGERGMVGSWMRRERKARGWSVDQTIAEMERAGYPVLPAYYRTVEAGPKPPGPQFISTLASIYGSEPPVRQDQGDPLLERLDTIIEALEQQSALIVQAIEKVGRSNDKTH